MRVLKVFPEKDIHWKRLGGSKSQQHGRGGERQSQRQGVDFHDEW